MDRGTRKLFLLSFIVVFGITGAAALIFGGVGRAGPSTRPDLPTAIGVIVAVDSSRAVERQHLHPSPGRRDEPEVRSDQARERRPVPARSPAAAPRDGQAHPGLVSRRGWGALCDPTRGRAPTARGIAAVPIARAIAAVPIARAIAAVPIARAIVAVPIARGVIAVRAPSSVGRPGYWTAVMAASSSWSLATASNEPVTTPCRSTTKIQGSERSLHSSAAFVVTSCGGSPAVIGWS